MTANNWFKRIIVLAMFGMLDGAAFYGEAYAHFKDSMLKKGSLWQNIACRYSRIIFSLFRRLVPAGLYGLHPFFLWFSEVIVGMPICFVYIQIPERGIKMERLSVMLIVLLAAFYSKAMRLGRGLRERGSYTFRWSLPAPPLQWRRILSKIMARP